MKKESKLLYKAVLEFQMKLAQLSDDARQAAENSADVADRMDHYFVLRECESSLIECRKVATRGMKGCGYKLGLEFAQCGGDMVMSTLDK